MNSTKGDNTPTNTLERLLYEYRYDSRAIDEDLVLQQNPADVEKAHQSNLEETKGQIEAMFAQAVNKAEITMWEKTTKAMMDILQENFQYRLMCGEVRDPDGKIDVMQGFVKYQELEPERKKFSEYLEGLKLELNRDEAPNQEKQNES